jgi:tRNA(Ile)-lysidine synthase
LYYQLKFDKINGMDAWEKFKRTVETENLVEDGDRILVGVSGGPDSVSLLHLLWRLRKTRPVELVAVCLDHGLRRQARREAALVAALGKKLGVETVTERIPVEAFAREHKVSLETAGRELRYRTFAALARQKKCTRIATGHTANDNAETVLMWLIRGTGAEGLSGIPLQRPGEGRARIIRPILAVTRAEILAYAARQKLGYCMDASNASEDFTRNRIRHRLIPRLQEFNPRIVEHLYSLSRITGAENEVLRQAARRGIARAVRVFPTRIVLDLKCFFRYNKIIQPRILKEILPEKRSAAQIERLRAWMSLPSPRAYVFSRSWLVEKNKHHMIFRKRSPDEAR